MGGVVIATAEDRQDVVPAGGALHCGAAHPDGRRKTVFAGRVHGVRLPAILPVPVIPTRRILTDFAEVLPGRIGIRCTCGAVNEFTPAEAPHAGAS